MIRDGQVGAWVPDPDTCAPTLSDPGHTEAMTDGERDEDGFPVADASNDGSVYVDEFEVAWVCE